MMEWLDPCLMCGVKHPRPRPQGLEVQTFVCNGCGRILPIACRGASGFTNSKPWATCCACLQGVTIFPPE